ncbi:MAG: hypothetical protein R3E14_09400 [Erythrobacter sp.]
MTVQVVDTSDQWEEFLNPDVIRTKLIAAGLFLVGHEMLLDSITRHPLSFFSNRWTTSGPERSAEYKTEILARDPKGKGDAVRGSIAWLRMMEVITPQDECDIKAVTDMRNELAHEMTAMVSGSKAPNHFDHFAKVMNLVQKIEKWWIVNVELSTNPDYDGQEIDEEGIISGPSLVIQMLSRIALAEGDEAWEFHREFVSRREGSHKT